METQSQQQALAATEQASAQAATTSLIEEHKAQSWTAAQMVTGGDCPGAEAYALSVGNFTLAKQVKDYCAK